MRLKTFKTKFDLTQIIFISFFVITSLLLIINMFLVQVSSFTSIFTYVVLILVCIPLLYLAYVDFKSMEIDNMVSLFLMVFLFVLNIYLFFFFPFNREIMISENFSYIPYNNFVSALSLGLVFFLVVLITKEKALGDGDIRIGIIVGLLIGQSNLISWLYITIFSSLIYGLFIAYKERKIKNLRIPFAPFMILGGIVCLILDMYF